MEQAAVTYEIVDGGVALIELNRPHKANAQNVPMTYELNEAFDKAVGDDDVRAIVLAAAGKHFSAGHDLTDPNRYEQPDHCVSTWSGWAAPGAEGRLTREHEIYFDMCMRWRELSKPTVAAVQGKCIGGGLMLAWSCDLIVAGESTVFQDPVVNFGMNGVEWLAHPWELGPRKAKELLMTAEAWTAREAEQLGMVNKVVADEQIRDTAVELARRIAAKPTMAVKLIKSSVNASVDAQGYQAALANAFGLHQLAHAHNMLLFGSPMDPNGLPEHIRTADPQWQVGGGASTAATAESRR